MQTLEQILSLRSAPAILRVLNLSKSHVQVTPSARPRNRRDPKNTAIPSEGGVFVKNRIESHTKADARHASPSAIQ